MAEEMHFGLRILEEMSRMVKDSQELSNGGQTIESEE